MTDHWRKLAARFDTLAERERILIFIAAVAGTIFVFLALAIDPLLVQQKRLTQQIADTRQSIRTADGMLKARQVQTDPDAVRRAYRDELRRQLAEIDSSMQGLQKRLVPPERMSKLLEEVLGKSRGLRLLSLRTLPVQRFDSPGSAPTPAADKARQPAPKEGERNIYQHSVELTLEGSYVDLHDYLARLERSPLHMFWGRLTLDAGGYPRLRATLTVHTLSLSRAWLIV